MRWTQTQYEQLELSQKPPIPSFNENTDSPKNDIYQNLQIVQMYTETSSEQRGFLEPRVIILGYKMFNLTPYLKMLL